MCSTPMAHSLVFGGRGLGKSALLNSAAEQFQEQTKTVGERVAVYLDLKAVGIRAGRPSIRGHLGRAA